MPKTQLLNTASSLSTKRDAHTTSAVTLVETIRETHFLIAHLRPDGKTMIGALPIRLTDYVVSRGCIDIINNERKDQRVAISDSYLHLIVVIQKPRLAIAPRPVTGKSVGPAAKVQVRKVITSIGYAGRAALLARGIWIVIRTTDVFIGGTAGIVQSVRGASAKPLMSAPF